MASTSSALSPFSPIYSPKPMSHAISIIPRLPVELIMLIFRLCHPGVGSRLNLTHVCRQWRSIAISSPSLWTFVEISIEFSPYSTRSDNMLTLLNIQLSRASGYPLDVEWTSNTTTGLDPRLLDLIRLKGPFSQWRTLTVGTLNFKQDEGFVLDWHDVFTNLQSLVILPSHWSIKLLETVRRTAIKLQSLELRNFRTSQMEMEANYQGIMWHINHLKIFFMNITSAPANIRVLEASFQSTHYFPYIRIYALILCEFKHNQPCDLRNLTHLTVTLGIILYDEVEVYLPTLRHLACGALITGYCTRIDVPVLEILHLRPINCNDRDVRHMIDTLNLDDSMLSPTKSITVDAYLPRHTTVAFLEHSPHVEQVSLSFADAYDANKMLERMEGVTHVEWASLSLADADEAENIPKRMEGATRVGNPEDCVLAGRLCERMRVLVINLGYERRDVEAWKRRASRLVESRRTFGSRLHVYAAWKGDGAYVLLA